MAGSVSDDSSHESLSSSAEIISTGQVSHASDSVGEWRSSEQVENGIPSTSPPYWDTDDDDDDFGSKPSDLYGKFTWKIENFSQISKRELRSNVFEVGGYKWYILIYPQGCDVCNHLSLFLCVANHDKLLPGWSHFAQFTIAVVNKDSKKSKYSDTLHRFWKKEHDWGWKKFMELSKLSDGFIVADALVIKAQVQVIREKAHRPFRCLDCQYRRELVRVYLSNVEQLCRRYVEEKRVKFSKVIEDKVRWSSFRAFWLGVDQSGRRWMSREKTETILKVVVKHFFIEKEVTSTLVMDSLYSGLKALEGLSKNKGSIKLLEGEEMAAPFIYVEKDMFSLTEDVLVLLERVVLEPILPKDEKASQNQSQNRTKDSSSGEEFSKDSIERDERRLTELGRRTVEIFIINHIFSSRIEVAYQEAVALKRQEELIREEEAAGQAEIELRSRRLAAEKEKRAKKKQAKQKRSARKGKERAREEKADSTMLEKTRMENTLNELSEDQSSSVLDKVETADVSDVSDVDEREAHADVDERDSSPDVEKSNPPAPDNGSVSCPADSNSTVAANGSHKKNFYSPVIKTSSNSSARGKLHQTKNTREKMLQSETSAEVSVSSREIVAESKVSVPPQPDSTQWLERQNAEKEAVPNMQRKTTVRDQIDENRPTKPLTTEMPTPIDPSNYNSQHTEKTLSSPAKPVVAQRQESTKPAVNPSKIITRPPSAPLIPGPRPASPHVSVAQQAPLLARSVSAAGRLGFDSAGSTLLTHGNTVVQSYRNAIMGKTAMSCGAASYTPRPFSAANHGGAATYSQSMPVPVLQKSTRVDPVRSVLTFGSVSPEALQNRHQWGEELPPQQLHSARRSLVGGIRSLNISAVPAPHPCLSDEASPPLPMQDEFPHLDIINDLLDEGHPMTGTPGLDAYPQHHHHHDHHHALARHYTLPREISSNGGRLFYGDGVQRMYGSPSNHYSGDLMDYSAYINGQSQWQMGGADHLPLDGGGYPYHDTSDMASGMNGYGMFHRPGNGP